MVTGTEALRLWTTLLCAGIITGTAPILLRLGYLSGWGVSDSEHVFHVFAWHLVVLSLGISFHAGWTWIPGMKVIAADVASGS